MNNVINLSKNDIKNKFKETLKGINIITPITLNYFYCNTKNNILLIEFSKSENSIYYSTTFLYENKENNTIKRIIEYDRLFLSENECLNHIKNIKTLFKENY
jgi:DNA mismatch repair ATPase MutL